LSAFDDRSRPPQDTQLASVLGSTYALWNEIREHVASTFAPTWEEWGFTSKSLGWGLRLKHGQRTIVSLIPRDGLFLASFALGEKAVDIARASGLPPAVLAEIDGARRYAEGRGVRLEVRDAEMVAAVRTLAAAKMAR
jgi:hypothetical protein